MGFTAMGKKWMCGAGDVAMSKRRIHASTFYLSPKITDLPLALTFSYLVI